MGWLWACRPCCGRISCKNGPHGWEFDWPSADQVIDKIAEEAAELREARDELTQTEVEEEFGDLLFVMANLGRHLGGRTRSRSARR